MRGRMKRDEGMIIYTDLLEGEKQRHKQKDSPRSHLEATNCTLVPRKGTADCSNASRVDAASSSYRPTSSDRGRDRPTRDSCARMAWQPAPLNWLWQAPSPPSNGALPQSRLA